MEHLPVSIFGFLTATAAIIYSGTKLSFYGNRIAEITGMGKAWAGLILMASVTSLPELLTGISSVAIIKQPDLAAGDIFGSCVFNLMLLSVLDAQMKKPLFSIVKSSHIVAAIFSIILLSIAGIAVFLGSSAPSIYWMSSFTPALFGIYFIAVWGISKYENEGTIPIAEPTVIADKEPDLPFAKVVTAYAMHAFFVIAAAVFLPYFGADIALHTGLGNTFFGTLFMAAATSLPELIVSLAALRMGAPDMAVGNLLGSNVFNIFILGIDDLFYTEGSLFAQIAPLHLLSILVTIIITAVAGLGLLFRPARKQVWHFSIDTFIIVVLYLGLITFLYCNT